MSLAVHATDEGVTVSFVGAAHGDNPNPALLVIDIADIREAVAALRAWETIQTTHLRSLLPAGETLKVEGVGTAEVKSGSDDDWDDAATVAAVAAEAIANRKLDETTGEIEPEGRAVARAIMACAGFNYWRKKALRARGIHTTGLVTQGETRWWVSIR